MRIYSMTATFGKLDRETLTLEPGLNVIHAPNEWGKSTWCAFLTAMLYGLETRTHSTKTALSDREHYTPWSGAPMAGTMNIRWQGRDITIERSTKGARPLGQFRAYETHTGLPVPELTAANCGQMLLGVERSVFLRTGFLRLTDLPVTQDESLRRRFNALVTTGDDSNTADLLEKKLRDLKNRCRYNRTGLLPQAESEAAALENRLRELDRQETQAAKLEQQRLTVQEQLSLLENHIHTLRYQKHQADALRLSNAEAAVTAAEQKYRTLEDRCTQQPELEVAQARVHMLEDLLRRQDALDARAAALCPEPCQVQELPHLQGMTAEAARETARADASYCEKAMRSTPLLWLLPALIGLLAAIGLLLGLPDKPYAGWIALGLGLSLTVWLVIQGLSRRKKARRLASQYPNLKPAQWESAAEHYVNSLIDSTRRHAILTEIQATRAALRKESEALCGTQSPFGELTRWKLVLQDRQALEQARQDWEQAVFYRNNFRALLIPVEPPARPDALDLNPTETNRQIREMTAQLHHLHSQLGLCRGQLEAMDPRTVLEQRLATVKERIQQLEDHYAATILALEALEEARRNLQRRFSPQITRRAKEILGRLTEGRYDRLLLDEDLSLQSAAHNEDMLRSVLWRSDGTADQLWLALRLAAADALTPDTPLVLDDALVRFDDRRLAAAMAVLKEQAQTRQILLFTCHSRESAYL